MIDLSRADRSEVYRYMGLGKSEPDERLREITEDIIKEISGGAMPKFCICDTSVSIDGIKVSFDSFSVFSSGLANHLSGCSGALFFAATLGSEVDRIISKYSVISPVKAVAAQAAAAAMIELFADSVCEQIQRDEKIYLIARFSPGYSDFSLEYQKKLLDILNAQKRIGLCLTDGNLLTPIKSITAVIGKKDTPDGCAVHKCKSCPNTDCTFRKS